MALDSWDDLKFVLAMTRHGTMSAAARYLDTNVRFRVAWFVSAMISHFPV
jgi:hypothetical protein